MIKVRKAEINDVKMVVSIHNTWALQNRKNDFSKGFLILTTDPQKIALNLNRDDRIFLVAFTENEIVGYLIASTDIEMINNLQWIQDVEPLITNANHWHILEMAVHPRLAGKGIGKLLYHDLFKVANGSHFSGYVATSPYRNDTSIHFHEKMGFKAVANFQAEEFCGLTNYSSTLYFR